MRIASKRKRKLEGESGSLSDLAFLLIIYFLVIAGFNLNQGFLMNLPEKDSTRMVESQDLLKLQLHKSGESSLEGEFLDLESLNLRLANLVQANPNLTVRLEIHPDVAYQNLIHLVAMARELQLVNFSFDLGEDI